jgi:hypothetical protein
VHGFLARHERPAIGEPQVCEYAARCGLEPSRVRWRAAHFPRFGGRNLDRCRVAWHAQSRPGRLRPPGDSCFLRSRATWVQLFRIRMAKWAPVALATELISSFRAATRRAEALALPFVCGSVSGGVLLGNPPAGRVGAPGLLIGGRPDTSLESSSVAASSASRWAGQARESRHQEIGCGADDLVSRDVGIGLPPDREPVGHAHHALRE